MDLTNKYGTLEMQKGLLPLLKRFDAFCLRNGINYSISSGTLLGAVRNLGFIPWDDDVDVIVSRTDYNKILDGIVSQDILKLDRIARDCLWTDRIRFAASRQNDESSPTIDVFILDNCPEGVWHQRAKVLVIKLLQGMIKYRITLDKGSFLMKTLSVFTFLLGRPFPHKLKYNWYHKVAQWGNDRPSRYLGSYHDQFKSVGIVYEKNVMTNIERIPFEDIEVNAFVLRDKYLRLIYGDDYMTPPQEEDRVPQHMHSR